MKRVAEWVMGIAAALGGPGLFLLSFLDSSFLSLPEVVDILLMGLVIHHPEGVVYYALLATLGSLAGCCVLYEVGRRGGAAFLRKRFHERHLDRGLAVFQKYGLLSVAIPSILPPPVPFKLFVLAAGVAGVRRVDFIVAVLIGRGIRYFGEAFLALFYGQRAITFVDENARTVSLVVALVVLALGAGWVLWRRRSSRRPASSGGTV